MNAIPVIICIIDDDADVRKALSRLLRSAGYTTRLFGSAGEFLVSGEARFSAGCNSSDTNTVRGSGERAVSKYPRRGR